VTDFLAEILSVLNLLEVNFTVFSPKAQLARSDPILKSYYKIPGIVPQHIQVCSSYVADGRHTVLREALVSWNSSKRNDEGTWGDYLTAMNLPYFCEFWQRKLKVTAVEQIANLKEKRGFW